MPPQRRLLGRLARPHFPSNVANLMTKCDKNWRMPGCRSGHIGQLRADPLPECCRSRRVSTEDFNLAPIDGRNDKNRQGPLGKPPKLGKSDMTPKWAGPHGLGPGHLRFLLNIDWTCSPHLRLDSCPLFFFYTSLSALPLFILNHRPLPDPGSPNSPSPS